MPDDAYAIPAGTPLEQQLTTLARFIMEQIPGEPSASEGAVETAIRILRTRFPRDPNQEYDWKERAFYTGHGAPEGMCWSVREMFSYGDDLDRFIPHLEVMAEGLERARFSEYDDHDGYNGDECYGRFVIGLRPMTAEDKTEADHREERRIRNERALLADLAAKYPDVLSGGAL